MSPSTKSILVAITIVVMVVTLIATTSNNTSGSETTTTNQVLLRGNLLVKSWSTWLLEQRYGLLVNHNPRKESFQVWKKKIGKSYTSPQEEEQRFNNFQESLKLIEEHQQRLLLGENLGYQLGLTIFADMSGEEFMEHFNLNSKTVGQECSATQKRVNQQQLLTTTKIQQQQQPDNHDLPTHVDWREKGYVTPVKNQGHCGSCWTFSTTGTLESHWKMKTGREISLSEQQLLDCATNYDNHGCNGGLPSHAFQYILESGGLDTERAYPYLAANGDKCGFKRLGVGAKVKGVVNITQFDEHELLEAVALVGPVSIAFQVTSDFRLYVGGVYSSTICGNKPTDVNHAVVAVGLDVSVDGVPYWIIKNSWGAEWGMQGYFWMKRGVNMCGIADCASYPLV
jgi:cathepsin H